jgi:AcrR family transcriptional regulator
MNTRQQILDAVERIVRAKGIAYATTKEIAREAGFAEGTLYKHFQHKEELFLAALQQHLPGFIEALGEIQAGQGMVRSNLERIALAAISYYQQLVPLATAFLADSELLARHQHMLDQIGGGPQRTYERVASYVEAEQRLGRIDPHQEPLDVAMLLLGPCFQYAYNRHLLGRDPPALTDQQFVSRTVQTLVAGIAKREGHEG